MLRLDPDDARPPYAQVVETIRRDIELGLLAAGAKLRTHHQLSQDFGVSIGTIKRALGELQGAGLIISRQGQGTFVRTRRSLLDSVPQSFSAETLSGFWVTAYQFKSERGLGHHADITKVTPQSTRRLVARNYPPDPRTQGQVPAFRNEIEGQVVNRHVIGNWKNVSDTRYFGSIHLAVLPGEAVMHGFYTTLFSDVRVDSMPWTWIRLDPSSLVSSDVAQVKLRDAKAIFDLIEHSLEAAPLHLATVVEENT